MSNIELLCDIGELNHLFHDSIDVAETQDLAQKVLAQTTVEEIAKILKISEEAR